jgi:hypothetical protein
MEGRAMEQCAKCGAAEIPETLEVAGVTFTGAVAGWRCAACSTTYLDGPAFGRFELATAARLLDAGVHAGEVLKFARKALGLRAAELGELLDVRPETKLPRRVDLGAPRGVPDESDVLGLRRRARHRRGQGRIRGANYPPEVRM